MQAYGTDGAAVRYCNDAAVQKMQARARNGFCVFFFRQTKFVCPPNLSRPTNQIARFARSRIFLLLLVIERLPPQI